MRKLASVTAALAVTALGLVTAIDTAPADGAAPHDATVVRTDPSGDVVLTDDRGTPPETVKRSPSDVKKVRIRVKRTGADRYLAATFSVRKLTRGGPVNHTAYVLRVGYLKAIRVTPLKNRTRAVMFNDDGLVVCRDLRTRVRTDVDRVWVKVPRRCLRRGLINYAEVRPLTIRTKNLRDEYLLTYTDKVRPTRMLRLT